MNTKIRLIILNFLQFFVWGSWLISLGGYMIKTLGFTGIQVGSVYATMGIASIFMPAILGIIADRWVNAERVMGAAHLIGAVLLFFASSITDFSFFYLVILLYSMSYMPTIALDNTVSYSILEQKKMDIVKTFPPIRVWGTIGFITAMWVVDLIGLSLENTQLLIAAGASAILGVYTLSLPACPPENKTQGSGWFSALGLDAFVLFKQKKMLIFFVFSMLLGAALQITNLFGEPYLHDFDTLYPDSFAVKHPGVLMSLSQMSETLFILTIPFFLRRFGIKKVMLLSMFAWVLRFSLFGVGNPDTGFAFLILSMIVYGMAFDFFNISGSLFVELEAEPKIRASAQGLFIIMTNGLGATLGGFGSGFIVDYFTNNGVKEWETIWFTFAAYALIIAISFLFIFKYKHEPEKMGEIKH